MSPDHQCGDRVVIPLAAPRPRAVGRRLGRRSAARGRAALARRPLAGLGEESRRAPTSTSARRPETRRERVAVAAPGRMGLHRAVHVGVHQHLPGVPRAPAGHPGVEGQLAGGHRAGAQQPVARRRGRRPGGHVRQPVLRQAERPHVVAPWGMRRPWMVIGLLGGSLGVLVVAVAPNVPVVLLGWCLAQLFFNALLAALVAVLPDQVPVAQRGLVSGVLGVCLPIASVSGTFLVKLFTGNQLAMFLVPCAIGGFFILLFAATLRRSPAGPGGQAGLVAAGVRQHVLRQPAEEPGLRLGLRQPLPVRAGLRVPGDLPGLLPAGQDRQRRGRRAAADLPRHPRPVRRRRRRVPDRRPALRPDRPTEDLRRSPRRSSTAWRCS